MTKPEITLVDFPENQYYKIQFPKNQIYLHHTAGNADAKNVFHGWKNDVGLIGTCVSISGKGKNTIDGEIVQGFSSKFWAYHLGVKTKYFQAMKLPYKELDKISIGIEICNWGQLTLKDNKFYNYVNREIAANILKQTLEKGKQKGNLMQNIKEFNKEQKQKEEMKRGIATNIIKQSLEKSKEKGKLMQIIKEYNKEQRQIEEEMAKTGYTGSTADITQQQLLRELRKTRSDKGESRGPYKTRSKTEFRQDPTDAAAAEQAEIDRLVNLSIQAQAAQVAQEQPAALTEAKRGPGRPKKQRNPVGRPKKQMPSVPEDTQGAKGAGF